MLQVYLSEFSIQYTLKNIHSVLEMAFLKIILLFIWNNYLIIIDLCRDAKIAALEKTSQETEKIIAEARSENIKQMDQVHAAQKRVHDLETRSVFLDNM